MRITDYIQGLKSIADKLAIINASIDDDDLVIHTFNGLGSKFKEVLVALCTHENVINFDEFHDMCYNFKSYLQRN